MKTFAAPFIKDTCVSLKSAQQGHHCQRESASLGSAATQNFDTLRGANYGVTLVQHAALSSADRTLLRGCGGATKLRKERLSKPPHQSSSWVSASVQHIETILL